MLGTWKHAAVQSQNLARFPEKLRQWRFWAKLFGSMQIHLTSRRSDPSTGLVACVSLLVGSERIEMLNLDIVQVGHCSKKDIVLIGQCT